MSDRRWVVTITDPDGNTATREAIDREDPWVMLTVLAMKAQAAALDIVQRWKVVESSPERG